MRRLALFVVIAALAAGCSSDAQDAPPSPVSSSSPPATSASIPTPTPTVSSPSPVTPSTPTVPADVPTTGPNAKASERPPVMPLEATQHTPAGARAFAKFFLQTVDWGYATTSSAYMRRYFQPSCQTCLVVRYSLDNALRDGKHYVGGRVTVLRVEPAKAGGAKHAEISARAIVNITAIEAVDRQGKASSPDVAYTNYGQTCGLRWLHSSWQIVSLAASKS